MFEVSNLLITIMATWSSNVPLQCLGQIQFENEVAINFFRPDEGVKNGTRQC